VTTTCPCGKPAPDAAICRACTADLNHQLGRIPDLWAEVATQLGGTRGIDYTRMGGPQAADRPLPIDTTAAETRAVITNTMATWCRVLIEHGFNYEKEVSLWPPF
jgi:hypothetical protein